MAVACVVDMGHGLCECGCGTPIAPDHRGRPRRFIHGHNRRKPLQFFESEDTNCWIWILQRNPQGYGQVEAEGRKWRAHRYFYEQFVGPVPREMQLHHLCDNPSCVNPGHLEPLTAREHVLLGNSEGAKNARKRFCKRGHPLGPAGNGKRVCKICRRLTQQALKDKRRGWNFEAWV